MLRERRIPLVFASYPSHLSLRVGEQGDDAVWAEATARALGLKVVSYWDPLRAANLSIETLYALPHDGHPRPAGYAVAASHLAGALTRDGLLPLCRAARGERVE